MMGIIDGTGVWSNDSYNRLFRHSYCRQTYAALGRAGHAARYNRGPSDLGLETARYARVTADWIKVQHAARPTEPVYLMGYSRGGSAVVTAANWLRYEVPKLRIAAMFLFDAVDRSIGTDGASVPANVAVCHHVVRDYSEHTTRRTPQHHNRWWFNNDALEAERGVELDLYGGGRNGVYGSHGALGGMPWEDDARDPQALIIVANWMNARLQRHGLPRALNPALCYPEGSAMDQRVERMLRPNVRPNGLRPGAMNGLQSRVSGR